MTLKEKNLFAIIGGAVFYVVFMVFARFMYEPIEHIVMWSTTEEAMVALCSVGFILVWCFGNWCERES